MKEKGFTLVELSIVLVIIGLLIGGILGAQSMIETTKVNKIVSQIQQYDAMVTNFQTKYNGLPGDSKAMGCIDAGYGTACDDGLINGVYGSSQQWIFEIANFWVQLQQGGFEYQNKKFTATIPTATGFDTTSQTPNAPTIFASTPNAGILGMYCGMGNSVNCWQIGDFSGYATGTFDGADYFWRKTASDSTGNQSFKPKLALAIDKKMDDGSPTTGYVRHWIAYFPGSTFANQCINGSGNYDLTNTGIVCYLSIGMLSQTGQGN